MSVSGTDHAEKDSAQKNRIKDLVSEFFKEPEDGDSRASGSFMMGHSDRGYAPNATFFHYNAVR